MSFKVVQTYLNRVSGKGTVKLPPGLLIEVRQFVERALKEPKLTIASSKFYLSQDEMPYGKLHEDEIEFRVDVYGAPKWSPYYQDGSASGWASGKEMGLIRYHNTPKEIKELLDGTLPHELIHIIQQNTGTPKQVGQVVKFVGSVGGNTTTKYRGGLNADGSHPDEYYLGEVEFEPQIVSAIQGCIAIIERQDLITQTNLSTAIQQFVKSGSAFFAALRRHDPKRYKIAYAKLASGVLKHFKDKGLIANFLDSKESYIKFIQDRKNSAKERSYAIFHSTEKPYFKEVLFKYPDWLSVGLALEYRVISAETARKLVQRAGSFARVPKDDQMELLSILLLKGTLTGDYTDTREIIKNPDVSSTYKDSLLAKLPAETKKDLMPVLLGEVTLENLLLASAHGMISEDRVFRILKRNFNLRFFKNIEDFKTVAPYISHLDQDTRNLFEINQVIPHADRLKFYKAMNNKEQLRELELS